MEKMVRRKLAVMMLGAAMLAGSGLYAGMKCAPGKCGASMKEMKDDKMPCGCKKDNCKCNDEEKGMKCGDGKCGEGMKEKMKGEMKGKCASGKCGGM